MQYREKANALFKKRVRSKEARSQLTAEGLLLDDIDTVIMLLDARYRQLKAALRARI